MTGDIYDYIEPENPLADLALDELSDLGRASGTRELVTHPCYMLVYDIVGKQIRVLNVVHTARQWPPVLGELKGTATVPISPAFQYSQPPFPGDHLSRQGFLDDWWGKRGR